VDELRHAFLDTTLEVSMYASGKEAARATFAKATPDKPPGQDAKAKKAAADKRKAADASTTSIATGTKPGDGTRPPTKK
jgi:hypothetical protein